MAAPLRRHLGVPQVSSHAPCLQNQRRTGLSPMKWAPWRGWTMLHGPLWLGSVTGRRHRKSIFSICRELNHSKNIVDVYLRIKYLKDGSCSIYSCSIIHFSAINPFVQYVPNRVFTTQIITLLSCHTFALSAQVLSENSEIILLTLSLHSTLL